MKDYIKQIADGHLTAIDVIERLKGLSKKTIEEFLDEMAMESIFLLIEDGSIIAHGRSKTLVKMVDAVAYELLPEYDKLRKPTKNIDKKMPKNKERLNEQLGKLQFIKDALIEKEIIVNGKWQGSAAEYGDLVFQLKEQWGVINRGGYAWTPIAKWVGCYDKGFIKNAQRAKENNPGEACGDIAEYIRKVCKNPNKKEI